MTRQAATDYVDYQERGQEFSVGDRAAPFGFMEAMAGTVTAVYPAIGMVDIEFPGSGNRRFPAEDLQRFNDEGNVIPTHVNSTPGGTPTVRVPAGGSGRGVRAMYWVECDRRYRMNKNELASGRPCCPRCGPESPLKKAIYKRRDGQSTRLMGCPNCMFLVKTDDIVNHPNNAPALDEGCVDEGGL
jgi:hypothetical protein